MKIDRIKYEQGTQIGEFHESVGAEAILERNEFPETGITELREWVHGEMGKSLIKVLQEEVKNLRDEALRWETRIDVAKKKWASMTEIMKKLGVKPEQLEDLPE